LGVKEIVIGMPHRGRLSVLANVMGKPYRAIFNEFQGGSASSPRTWTVRAT
jgi:2-oxoglutarate dehydrogenase E1 component